MRLAAALGTDVRQANGGRIMTITYQAVPVRGAPVLTASQHPRRSMLGISAEDDADFWASDGGWVNATDHITGTPIQLRRRACGLPCKCDAEYRLPR